MSAPDLSAWMADLHEMMALLGIYDGYDDSADAWCQYWADGYSPAEALSEDRSYWAEG